ncbi:endoplasmic reticulum membrane-associated RNA degradation protein-like [Scyliorhinus canicula]|uniref:endoplasmic reticulum membrane-associated RNA degradation protein-like n=1 Tax=Scyliorhinus canicula TaxID=7830 RepID=UPI0018F5C361|nr:endoplasmic reticulum membrane-associated RNA degradation protein-like [Scyliorhinus canicula]XP_038671784.1 endoplasmic reticulum membrane-associated RNA degradation protein-like [Scyliorhinus canicula]XP_038671792.1 endoplasmic reticulum membrane-associated RNA degradation protein-like [Scyliorhinus canicula]
MATFEPISTCLSGEVHRMVCNLGLEKVDIPDHEHIVTASGEVCWEAITFHLCTSVAEEQDLDYVECVRRLGPICKTVHLYLLSLNTKQFGDQYGLWFEWTNNTELFVEVFEAIQSSQNTAIALSLMKLTACLERALGDVFLMIGKECPFLLRDLLASQELATVFGQSVMNILRVFLGSPRILNLRNILWHGFAAPEEIPPMYTSMLLLLTAGLGQILKGVLPQRNLTLHHRPYLRLTQLEELAVFPDINEEAIAVAEELIGKSDFVLEIMLPFWREALTAYKHQRYADCTMLLLPQLEMGLRKYFTAVNNCPSRLLTAESTTLYTTFDEMLAKYLDNDVRNQLPTALGDPIMDILWDLLNHQEGPRLRDHLSHGELELKAFPREMASHVVALAVVLLHHCCSGDNGVVKEEECLRTIISSTPSYSSRFHPIGRLKRQLLHCVESLQKWGEMPRPTLGQSPDRPGFARSGPTGCLLEELVSNLINRLRTICTKVLNPSKYLLSEAQLHLVTELLASHMCTLYCPRAVLEVVSLLRKITSQCLTVSEQITSSAASRHQQWLNKSLRSRQRQNYFRMLDSVQYLHHVFSLLTLLITVELLNAPTKSAKAPTECHCYLKFLKSLLQYTENMATYTSPEKNKWDESWDLTEKMLLKVKNFYNKWCNVTTDCAM